MPTSRTYKYEVRVPADFQDADRLLFANNLMFNSLEIEISAEMPDRFTGDYGDSLHLAAVTQYGIVLSTDTVGHLGDNPRAGFHNCLIPWAQIRYMYQYIAT